jgi:hypothetical protein
MYPVTGSFYNPGPYGCYLALTVPLAVWVMFGIEKRGYGSNKRILMAVKILALIALLCDAVLMPVTMSRTAWVAAVIGTGVAFYKDLICFVKSRHLISTAGIIAIVIAGVWSYKIKEGSADGRFLLWKIAAMAIDAKPFTGVGWERVAGSYGIAQEAYFASSPYSETEKMVADAPAYVFNEYLQTGIAYGWGWSLIMSLAMTGGVIFALKGKAEGIAGCIVAGAVTMTASYPFQFTLSIFTIGAIICMGFLAYPKNKVSLLGALITVIGTVFLSEDCKLKDLTVPFDLDHAYHKSEEWKMSNRMMKSLLPYTSDPMPLIIIGKNYRELGMADSAAYYFNRALHRCPNRMYPHYQLMLLYADSTSQDMQKARLEAETILTMKEKIISPAVTEMREKASEIMYGDNESSDNNN